jgi:hypothetical protein
MEGDKDERGTTELKVNFVVRAGAVKNGILATRIYSSPKFSPYWTFLGPFALRA